jgi:dienelactone hydrolase
MNQSRRLVSALCFLVAFALPGAGAWAQEEVVYGGGSGLKGYLCVPAGAGPHPAALYNHGGVGEAIGGAPEETCRALAEAGYVGFSPVRRRTVQMRGHIDDVMAALAYLRQLDSVDRDRIAMLGFSRGALLSLMVATRRSDLKSVVVMAPAGGRGGLARVLRDARSITTPVLVMVAKNDTGSPRTPGDNVADNSREVDRALRAAGKEVRLIVYPPHGSDGHTLFFKVGDYWSDIEDFLNRYL